MRWFVGLTVLVAMVMMGCPSEFGREGRIEEAVLKDETENSFTPCSPAEIDQVCGDGKTQSLDCKRCGR